MFQYVQRRWIAFIIVICLVNLLCWPSAVHAEESVYDTYYQGSTKEKDVDGEEKMGLPLEQEGQLVGTTDKKEIGFLLVLKILFYLVIILVMIYGLIKFLATKQKKLGQQQLFKHIGGTSLGSNKSLQLVKFGQTYFLLGVAEQINLIKEITDPTVIAMIEENLEKQETMMPMGLGQLVGIKAGGDERETSISFQHMLKNSLENQKRKRTNVERKLNTSRDEQEEDTSV